MKSYRSSVSFALVGLLALSAVTCLAAQSESTVKLWQQSITLPTYEVAPPDPNPRFYQGRTYQGARATFYPYPVMDRLTDKKEDKSYKAVYLENPYIQISVLPELGGRIFTATDKGNGYDFFYRQHAIKPALIGMLGAWISGGVEWNVPHHHRATSFMPVDYTTVTNQDGSKTVWVGETELRHRLRWLVGLTVYSDRSYIEMTMKVINRTPLAHPILFWINPAVHANEQYQVIFPPATEWAVQHAKPEFASWPIAHQVYGGTDYTRGVDISWWKNHPSPVSFFAWNCQEDWFGGYDHGKEAGVLQWSDHHVAPGKKFFEWGNGPEGEMWSDVLSDGDGPYLELMAGAWSDNQPDYSWLQPGQVREWKHWWYPIRNLGGVKVANRDGAINLAVSEGAAKVSVNTTMPLDGELRVRAGEKEFLRKALHVSPAQPYSADIALEGGVDPEQLRVSLADRDGHELISFKKEKSKGTSMPKPVERPKAPKDYATIDELYFTGQRIEQLYSPAFEATPYYEEMLRRDPGEYRANTALGILLCRQWRWTEAASRLSNAVARATANYIRPKDGEALYYLGLALESNAQKDAAYEAYSRAAWSQDWAAPAYLALAQLETGRSNYVRALELVDRSLNSSGHNSKAVNLKITVLRKLGSVAEAQLLAEQTVQRDPLDLRAWNELRLTQKQSGRTVEAQDAGAQFASLMRSETQSHLELAFEYSGQGFYGEAEELLRRLVPTPGGTTYPIVDYCLADLAFRRGRPEEAASLDRAASQAPTLYCFPDRFEEVVLLRQALQRNPADGSAAYYLGNALYDRQPAEAIQAWETARQHSNFSLVHRNLGLAYAQTEKNVSKAIASLEQAVQLDSSDARLLYELDVQYEAGGISLSKRLDHLSQNRKAVELRDDATTRLIVLLTAAGQADEALRILRTRHFHNWEGSGELHDIYVNACLQSGLGLLSRGAAADALTHFQAALEYPRNQEVGKSKNERRVSEIYYQIGRAQEKLGSEERAKAAFEKAAGEGEHGASEGQYFRALALQKLGRSDEGAKLFDGLVKHGLAELERTSDTVDYFAKFGEKRAERIRLAQGNYLVGLGLLGQGKADDANARFAEALALNPCHLGALAAQKLPQG